MPAKRVHATCLISESASIGDTMGKRKGHDMAHKAWLWISGVPGSPNNDGWLEVLSAEFKVGAKRMQFRIPLDAAGQEIVRKCIRGDMIDEIIMFLEPQTEVHYYETVISNVQPEGGANPRLLFSVDYNKVSYIYSGSP